MEREALMEVSLMQLSFTVSVSFRSGGSAADRFRSCGEPAFGALAESGDAMLPAL